MIKINDCGIVKFVLCQKGSLGIALSIIILISGSYFFYNLLKKDNNKTNTIHQNSNEISQQKYPKSSAESKTKICSLDEYKDQLPAISNGFYDENLPQDIKELGRKIAESSVSYNKYINEFPDAKGEIIQMCTAPFSIDGYGPMPCFFASMIQVKADIDSKLDKNAIIVRYLAYSPSKQSGIPEDHTGIYNNTIDICNLKTLE